MAMIVAPVYGARNTFGSRMPEKTPKASRPKETWRDYMNANEPDPETLTRPQFVERLRAEGVDVAPRTLAHWESIGVIPRSSREWRDGAPHSIYPAWMAAVVRTVRGMQAQGATLEQIREAVRQTPWRIPMTPPDLSGATQAELIERFNTYLRASEALARKIAGLARLRELAYGVTILDVSLHFRDANGVTSAHGFGAPFGWLGDDHASPDNSAEK